MMGKAGLVLGLATGYVLGARDGRGRYEQIKTQAERLWNDPKVQQTAAAAQDFAKQKAPQVTDKIAQVTDKASGSGTGSGAGTGSTGTGTGTDTLTGTGTSTPSAPSAPKSVTPATAPVAKGPELHTESTPHVKPGGLDG
jgi:hypothetical protein